MSSVGGEIGGKLGNQQNPFFTGGQTGAGITPLQQALAEYGLGQSQLAETGNFQGSDQGGGPIMSTMDTQAAGVGPAIGEGLTVAGLSDTNTNAEYGAYNVANNIQAANQGSAISNINTLGNLAKQAGAGSSYVSNFLSGAA